MKNKNFLYIFLLSALIIKSHQFENCPYSITCNNSLPNCLKKSFTFSSEVYEITLNSCSRGKNKYSFCNVYDLLFSDIANEVNCTKGEETKSPTYPGGVCKTDNDCIYGVCINDICENTMLDGTCSHHEECKIGQACIEGSCKSLLKEKDFCRTSFECEFNLICINGKCEKSFYFPDNTNITKYINLEEASSELYCKSGGYYLKDSDYICETLLNENKAKSCKEYCTYYRKSDMKKIKDTSKCLCGYNKDRKRFCMLGNGEDDYLEYLSLKKQFLENNEYTKYCHTLERLSDNICIELINQNRTVKFRQFLQKYNNARVSAKEYPHLQEADDCVKYSMFKYDTSPVIPDKMSCPVVTCNNNQDSCLISKNPLNDEGDKIEISLNSGFCNKKEICQIGEEFNNIDSVFLNPEVKGKCVTPTYHTIRYPGESCDEILSPCVAGIKCVNGTCSGKKEDESCVTHSECNVGLFCSKTEKKCLPQKKLSEDCDSGWDCANYLGCYNGKCIKFASLKPGAKVLNGNVEENFPGETVIRSNYFCEYGTLDQTNLYCSLDYYDGETEKKTKEHDFIECEKDDICYYRDESNNKFSLKCECGYNDMGKGYCKLPSSLNKPNWKNYMTFLAEKTNNGCHSLSRFNCYLNNNIDFFREKRAYEAKTADAHLFHNAVPCANKIFGSQNYLTINTLSLLFLVIGLL